MNDALNTVQPESLPISATEDQVAADAAQERRPLILSRTISVFGREISLSYSRTGLGFPRMEQGPTLAVPWVELSDIYIRGHLSGTQLTLGRFSIVIPQPVRSAEGADDADVVSKEPLVDDPQAPTPEQTERKTLFTTDRHICTRLRTGASSFGVEADGRQFELRFELAKIFDAKSPLITPLLWRLIMGRTAYFIERRPLRPIDGSQAD